MGRTEKTKPLIIEKKKVGNKRKGRNTQRSKVEFIIYRKEF